MDEVQDGVPLDAESACGRANALGGLQLGMERLDGLSRDQSHGASVEPGRVNLPDEDLSGDERSDGTLAKSQRRSGLRLRDPGALRKQSAALAPLEQTDLATQVLRGIVPQQILPQGIGGTC